MLLLHWLPANMAEVSFGKGAYCFVHKICKCKLLENPNNLSKSAIEASRLSAGCLLGGIQHGLCGGETAADTLTGELSQGGDATGPPPGGSVRDVCDREDVDSFGFKPHSCSSQAPIIAGPRYGHDAKLRRTSRASGSDSRRLFWKRVQICHFTRAYSDNGTRPEPLYKTKTGYYEILEVPPTATQAQIKSAYYKQCFIYHPDRNCGSEVATARFSEISEAYTVLGSKALRKKYDRGLLSQSDLTTTARPSAKEGSTAKEQHGGKRPVAGQHVQGGVFDFDTFYKSHYSEQLQRQRDIRVRKEEMLNKQKESTGEKQLGRMLLEIGIGMLLLTGLGILMSLKRG